MNRFIPILLAGALVGLLASPSLGQQPDRDARLTFGGDQFTAGQQAVIDAPVAHDAFMAGYNVSLNAAVSGNAHLAGYHVNTNADVTGDIYAAGFAVTVGRTVGGDVTAMGNSVSLRTTAPVPGNARLAGANVSLASAVTGSALITAQTLTLDAPIAGDLAFYGENLIFGPGAKVGGTISIQAPKEIAVPATVASADRVTFTLLTSPDYMGEAGKTAENVVKGFWPVFWAAAMWWLLLLVVGAIFIALMPRGMAAMQTVSEKRPFRNFGLGILAFASVVGLVPVFAFTVIGLLLLPFVILFAVIACSLAYLTGLYFVGLRIARSFVAVETNAIRLTVLAGSLVVATLIGMIPVVGWFISLGLLTFGFGVIAVVLMVNWTTRDAARLHPGFPLAGIPATPGAV
jgi:hypothetical protein